MNSLSIKSALGGREEKSEGRSGGGDMAGWVDLLTGSDLD